MKEQIKREVHGNNQLRIVAKAVLAKVLPMLTQFVGKKIFTADGSNAKIFNIELPQVEGQPLPNGFCKTTRCYFSGEYKELRLHIGICLSGGDAKKNYCQYFDRVIGLGTMDNASQILETLDTIENIINVYALDKIVDFDAEMVKIDEYLAKKEELANLSRNINVSSHLYI